MVRRNGGTVVLRWSLPDESPRPVDGFEYAFAKKGDAFSPSKWVSTGGGVLSATVEGLETGKTYIFHVVAFNLDSRGRRLYSLTGFLEVTTSGST